MTKKTEILRLREDGYTMPQIAAELCIPINTVKSFLYRKSQPAAEDGPAAEPTTPLPMPPPSPDRVVRPSCRSGTSTTKRSSTVICWRKDYATPDEE